MPCAWDATEFMLKASLMPQENVLLSAWIRGYTNALDCFPRLHVVTAQESLGKATRLFRAVPNISLHANGFPDAYKNASKYSIIQWHCFWADNFTTAPFVFFFDVDAVPILPLRCHMFFDASHRLLQHAWRYVSTNRTGWVKPCSDVFLDAQAAGQTLARTFTPFMEGLDFMSFWPIVAPRWAMPRVRQLVLQSQSGKGAANFDEAFFLRMEAPSHADLIGKTLMTSFPERVRVVLCPDVFNRTSQAIRDDLRSLDGVETHHHSLGGHFPCRDKVAAIEHVRHPLQGLHSPGYGVKYKPFFRAAEYAHELINESLLFRSGAGPIPSRLFHYSHVVRTEEHLKSLSAALLDPGPPGRVCGVG